MISGSVKVLAEPEFGRFHATFRGDVIDYGMPDNTDTMPARPVKVTLSLSPKLYRQLALLAQDFETVSDVACRLLADGVGTTQPGSVPRSDDRDP